MCYTLLKISISKIYISEVLRESITIRADLKSLDPMSCTVQKEPTGSIEKRAPLKKQNYKNVNILVKE
jgi:hypothetical protein